MCAVAALKKATGVHGHRVGSRVMIVNQNELKTKWRGLGRSSSFIEDVVWINVLGLMNAHIAAGWQMIKQGSGGCILGAGSIASYHTAGCLTSHEGISVGEAEAQHVKNDVLLRRIQEAEDVAKLVTFLASDEAECLTGQMIKTCGVPPQTMSNEPRASEGHESDPYFYGAAARAR
ncbi:uncharacterized protein LAESUDRAFT_714062 [Laetiporus sulphureus 93-53]|uniref:NAD(P)-binding protein n=1 Tax=Laetiporus sulphureus 93-53 TaxID=1314785 RepID=A0A165EAH5_9APHY|nr:uncharacterized protein LAESUDRAFT_714062 [Laetiporus sulphureus 93-53]KZT06593.1 hypothetical protein LAESUDRAFT_714062 [Laetiporus sulphureus 93-53]